MLLVLIGISILFLILAMIVGGAFDDDLAIPIGAVAGILFVTSLIFIIINAGNLAELRVVDDQIAMYQEENENIETQIGEMIQQYQKYETDIFTGIKPESSMALVSLYPELKSDTLVQEQIKVHTANNQKIKELKEKKINGSVYRWWLYFGK